MNDSSFCINVWLQFALSSNTGLMFDCQNSSLLKMAVPLNLNLLLAYTGPTDGTKKDDCWNHLTFDWTNENEMAHISPPCRLVGPQCGTVAKLNETDKQIQKHTYKVTNHKANDYINMINTLYNIMTPYRVTFQGFGVIRNGKVPCCQKINLCTQFSRWTRWPLTSIIWVSIADEPVLDT